MWERDACSVAWKYTTYTNENDDDESQEETHEHNRRIVVNNSYLSSLLIDINWYSSCSLRAIFFRFHFIIISHIYNKFFFIMNAMRCAQLWEFIRISEIVIQVSKKTTTTKNVYFILAKLICCCQELFRLAFTHSMCIVHKSLWWHNNWRK